jgi:hypothetical protein
MSFDSLKIPLADHPLSLLSREDLDLIVELVLLSGSLKDLAASYGVSYPTIRARLDKLIERLKAAVAGRAPDPLLELLADLVEQGQLSPAHARTIRDLSKARTGPAAASPSQGAQA